MNKILILVPEEGRVLLQGLVDKTSRCVAMNYFSGIQHRNLRKKKQFHKLS